MRFWPTTLFMDLVAAVDQQADEEKEGVITFWQKAQKGPQFQPNWPVVYKQSGQEVSSKEGLTYKFLIDTRHMGRTTFYNQFQIIYNDEDDIDSFQSARLCLVNEAGSSEIDFVSKEFIQIWKKTVLRTSLSEGENEGDNNLYFFCDRYDTIVPVVRGVNLCVEITCSRPCIKDPEIGFAVGIDKSIPFGSQVPGTLYYDQVSEIKLPVNGGLGPRNTISFHELRNMDRISDIFIIVKYNNQPSTLVEFNIYHGETVAHSGNHQVSSQYMQIKGAYHLRFSTPQKAGPYAIRPYYNPDHSTSPTLGIIFDQDLDSELFDVRILLVRPTCLIVPMMEGERR